MTSSIDAAARGRQSSGTAAPVSVQFVNISHPDDIKRRRNQTVIKRQAMKDIGLSRRRGKHVDVVPPPAPPASRVLDLEPVTTNSTAAAPVSSAVVRLDRGSSSSSSSDGGGSKSAVAFLRYSSPSPDRDLRLYSATDMRARRMKGFLLREHSPLCYKVRQVCFTIGLLDEDVGAAEAAVVGGGQGRGGNSALHLALAETALHHQSRLAPRARRPRVESRALYSEGPLALGHYNASLGLLYRRIQITAASSSSSSFSSSSSSSLGAFTGCSTGTFGIMLGLASYDLVVGNLHRWSMHMAGLEAMVRNRGGPRALTSDNLLKSLLWVDIAGAMLLDRRPVFDLGPDAFSPHSPPVLTPLLRATGRNLQLLQPHPPHPYPNPQHPHPYPPSGEDGGEGPAGKLYAALVSLSALPPLYGTEDPERGDSGLGLCLNLSRSAFLLLDLLPPSSSSLSDSSSPSCAPAGVLTITNEDADVGKGCDEHYYPAALPSSPSSSSPPSSSSAEAATVFEATRLAAHIWLVRVLGFLPETSGLLRQRAARLSRLLAYPSSSSSSCWDGLRELKLWVLAVAILGGSNSQTRDNTDTKQEGEKEGSTEKEKGKEEEREGREEEREEREVQEALLRQAALLMRDLGLDGRGVRDVLGQIAWVDDAFADHVSSIEIRARSLSTQ